MRQIIKWAIKLAFCLNLINNLAYSMLAGGRPNAISGGQNAFAGIVNPANAVWIKDRFDIGLFFVHQKLSLNNQDNNPLFPPGKINQTYKSEYLSTLDAAIHKKIQSKQYEYSFTLATYTTPNNVKLRTKKPFAISGTTPIRIEDKTQVLSSIFSLKFNQYHSIGFSLDYFYLSHRRDGYQRSNNQLRSVSPGHVTNKGMDHSSGIGISLGWRWNINKSLAFGLAFVKKAM